MASIYATNPLNSFASKGEWDNFLQFYQEHESTHKAAITDSSETPLHVALSRNAPENVVEKMLNIIVASDAYECLRMADKEGNTAFRLAASKGYSILGVAASNEHTVINLIMLFPNLVDELTNADKDTIRRTLFKLVMKGEWERVIEIYRGVPAVHEFKITMSDDTVLHIAMNEGKKANALDLVKIIKSRGSSNEKKKQVLKVRNERGDTPLHLAAALGYADICQSIVEVAPSLVSERNKDNETPIFSAVFNGEKYVFLLLHLACIDYVEIKDSFNWRRRDGATILHVAIAGDYFDLAFQIIHLYKDLVNSVDVKGTSPLHLLASKPSAFKSSSNLIGFPQLVYYCTFVEELRPEDVAKSVKNKLQRAEDAAKKPQEKYPENYKACVNVVWLGMKAVKVFLTQSSELTNDSTRDTEKQEGDRSKRHHPFPPNYICFFDLVKFFFRAMLIVVGLGSSEVEKIKEKKKMHTWAAQVMNKLLSRTKMYEYESSGGIPMFHSPPSLPPPDESTKTSQPWEIEDESTKPSQPWEIEDGGQEAFQTKARREAPILIAAKNGIKEMVEKILHHFPVAIQDQDAMKKNIVLLAVENRQPHVYEFLASRKETTDNTFRKVDSEGNTALHLAAKSGNNKAWRIPGAALQMQWEFKWYEYVKNSKPAHFFPNKQNTDGKTARELFTETHAELVKEGGQWLTSTSNSCSVVAALIATVAFATAATVPGGNNEENGLPVLENEPAFNVFSIASLVALCFSVTAMVMFLSILTSRHQERDFRRGLPTKLLFGLTALFVSIAAILVSFCAGHFFVLREELRFAAYPVYVVTCLPVTFFAMAQFPLYFDLLKAFLKKVPQRSYMVVGR